MDSGAADPAPPSRGVTACLLLVGLVGVAEELLLGVAGRVGSVTEGESGRPGWWRFTLRTSLTEHVDVCGATGVFSYTRTY